MVAPERRYDTAELVTEMRRERRNAVILGLAGVAVLLVLFLLYFTMVDQRSIPDAPEDAAPVAAAPSETPPPAEPPPTETAAVETPPAEAAPAEPEPEPPTKVTLVLPVKAPAWLDDKSLGKIKELTLEVPPGPHQLKVKVGKKTISQPFDAVAGESTTVRFEPKGKKKPKGRKGR